MAKHLIHFLSFNYLLVIWAGTIFPHFYTLAPVYMTPRRPKGSHIQMKRILEYRDTVPFMGQIITVILLQNLKVSKIDTGDGQHYVSTPEIIGVQVKQV